MGMKIAQLIDNEGNIILPITKLNSITGAGSEDSYLDTELTVDDINSLKGGKIGQIVRSIADLQTARIAVEGTDPVITAEDNKRYVCGEVATLSFTPTADGVSDVVFTSGTTPTVLTVPSTIKWVNGFDPTTLEANKTYELNIMEGIGLAVGVDA